MDEPFGALDPITRPRLQDELRRLHREVGKTVIFVTHDIDEAIRMGDRIAILREGGVLAQYDTPDAILAHPADDFVARFIGEDRALRRLALRRLGDVAARPAPATATAAPPRRRTRSVRNAVSQMLETDAEQVVVVDDDGEPSSASFGSTREERCCDAGAGPVIPNFGQGSSCVRGDHTFCWDWVREHWRDTLGPALVQHLELTAIAVAIGFSIAFALALLAHRVRGVEQPIGDLLGASLHDPEHRALPDPRPVHRHRDEDGRDRARRVHARHPLPQHPRRVAERAARGARGGAWHGPDAATDPERVELPLAVPLIIGGLRIAVVSTISIATIAAFLLPKGLGYPIFLALKEPTPFKTEIYSAGALAVGLALACDGPRRACGACSCRGGGRAR